MSYYIATTNSNRLNKSHENKLAEAVLSSQMHAKRLTWKMTWKKVNCIIKGKTECNFATNVATGDIHFSCRIDMYFFTLFVINRTLLYMLIEEIKVLGPLPIKQIVFIQIIGICNKWNTSLIEHFSDLQKKSIHVSVSVTHQVIYRKIRQIIMHHYQISFRIASKRQID